MPPFKSESQRKKFIQLEKEGKLKPGTVKKWEAETKGQLPERVSKSRPKSIQEIKEIRIKKYGK